jgi:hypothetical protein
MKLRTNRTYGHTTVEILGGDGRRFCGSSWCSGECGHAALVTHHNGLNLRAFGSQVACGPVFQAFRGTWIGEMVQVEGNPDALIKMMWW